MTEQVRAGVIYIYTPSLLFFSVLTVHKERSLSQELTMALQGISGI